MNDWGRIREALFADSARSRGTLEQAWRSVGCFVVGQPETARQAEEGLAALRIQIFDELGVDPVTLALGGRYDRCGPHHVLSTAGGPDSHHASRRSGDFGHRSRCESTTRQYSRAALVFR